MENKNLIKSIVFVVIFLLILAILSKIFIRKNNAENEDMQEKVARGISAEPENTIDLLIVGDSESYSSFIPLEVWHESGIASYVCGTPAQNLSHTLTLIKRATEKQNIKIIALETNELFRKFTIDKPLVEFVNKAFPVFDEHDEWKRLKAEELFSDVNYTNIQETKGYYYSKKIKRVKKIKEVEKTNKVKKIRYINKFYLRKIKEFCDKNNIKLILFSSPSNKNWTYEKHNGIQKLADQINADFIDLNLKIDELNIDWTVDSRDRGDHLNYTGALKVTKYMTDYFSENENLPDHRNDEKYNYWNILYDKYKNKIQEDQQKQN